jgi:hypothetical protein
MAFGGDSSLTRSAPRKYLLAGAAAALVLAGAVLIIATTTTHQHPATRT